VRNDKSGRCQALGGVRPKAAGSFGSRQLGEDSRSLDGGRAIFGQPQERQSGWAGTDLSCTRVSSFGCEPTRSLTSQTPRGSAVLQGLRSSPRCFGMVEEDVAKRHLRWSASVFWQVGGHTSVCRQAGCSRLDSPWKVLDWCFGTETAAGRRDGSV
jgi:hypothetical protein